MDPQYAYNDNLKTLGHDFKKIRPIALEQISDKRLADKIIQFFRKYNGWISANDQKKCYFNQITERYGAGFGFKEYPQIQDDVDYSELFKLAIGYFRKEWLPKKDEWTKNVITIAKMADIE